MNQSSPDREENVMLVRLTNLLYQYTGNETYKKMAQNVMRYIATPNIANQSYPAPVLLADGEITHSPLHITIVGFKDDLKSKTLYQAGLAYPSSYKRIEWWDRREGALPYVDVESTIK